MTIDVDGHVNTTHNHCFCLSWLGEIAAGVGVSWEGPPGDGVYTKP